MNNEIFAIKAKGAARGVTGSCFEVNAIVKSGRKVRFLIDCGLYQKNGSYQKKYELNTSRFTPEYARSVDFIILTHAHVDHCGMIPYLRDLGFTGPIYSTYETLKLCEIMLPDAAHISEEEANRQNKKYARLGLLGKEVAQPLYSQESAIESLKYFKKVPYTKKVYLFEGIKIRLTDAMHIPGSVTVEMWISGVDGKEIYGVCSGDIGENFKVKFERAPDFILLESTYGNRETEKIDSRERDLKLARMIIDTYKKGGKIVFPAFAVGRSQLIIFSQNQAIRFLSQEEAEYLKQIRIIIDSPMGIRVTKLFQPLFKRAPRHFECLLGADTDYYIKQKLDPFSLPNLEYSISAEDSRALNETFEPMAIISSSGMCNAGRILHHLKHNLWRPSTTVAFVGFQGLGTPGRRILDGEKFIKLFGEEIAVEARIENLPEFSAHAGQETLARFAINGMPKTVFLNHGEATQMDALQTKLEGLGIKQVICLELGDKYEIIKDAGAFLIEKQEKPSIVKFKSRSNDVMDNLNNLQRLFNDINTDESTLNSLSNEDLQQMVDAIRELSSSFKKTRGILFKLKTNKSRNEKKGRGKRS